MTFLQVEWSVDRYEDICAQLKQFLSQAGFASARTKFVPVCAYGGVNLVNRDGEESRLLNSWYGGPTLVDCLGMVSVHSRCQSADWSFQTLLNRLSVTSTARCGYPSPMSSRVRRICPTESVCPAGSSVVPCKWASGYVSCPVTKRPSFAVSTFVFIPKSD